MGDAPAMTIGTYTHVIRDRKGEPIVPAEAQIERGMSWFAGASPGLERGTPRFSVAGQDASNQRVTPAMERV
jgi:hypothetical protein